MSAQFTIKYAEGNVLVKINDDFNITANNAQVEKLLHSLANIRPATGYHPDPIRDLTEYLIEQTDGINPIIDQSSTINDPVGLVY